MWSALKPLGEVCKCIDLSWSYDSGVKSGHMAELYAPGAGKCSQIWQPHSWPTTVLKSRLSESENKWVSGG